MTEKILVTGASGFIGKRLIKKLAEQGHSVWGMFRYVTGRYVLGESFESVFADVADYSGVVQIVKDIQPDRVIHLAAISAVSYSYEHPNEVNLVNYLGTINLAESCRIEVPDLKQFVFAGSSEEYGNQTTFPIKEDVKENPNSPYSMAKNASTKYLQYMSVAYDFPMTVLRPFNTYGRTENLHFVTERIMSQMLRGQEYIRLGDPEPSRDLLYVDDHVNGYNLAIKDDKTLGEIINISTGKECTIRELVQKIAKETGWEGEVIWWTIPKRPLDIHRLVGDNWKARQLMQWTPTVGLDEGLRETVKGLRPQFSL